LFDEFCAWAIRNSLDLEDDDDVYDGDMVAMNVNRQGQNQAYIKQYADKKKTT